jgi:deoxyribonuclease-4
MLDKTRFGPTGYPADSKRKPEAAFEIIKEAGLDAFEYAAVYGLRLSKEKAEVIGGLAKKYDVVMSIHAAYYINLASKSSQTQERSKKRLIKALQFAPLMNVKRIVFHPGTLGGLSREKAHDVIFNGLQEVWEKAGHLGHGALLAPENAGRINAYGTLEEIIRLCEDGEGLIPTIDWAHVYAHSQGKANDKDSFLRIMTRFENRLGSLYLDNMHFHISGIMYTSAGEKSHKPLGKKWGPDILPLMEIISETGYHPVIISETPTPLQGALYAKFLLEELEKDKG